MPIQWCTFPSVFSHRPVKNQDLSLNQNTVLSVSCLVVLWCCRQACYCFPTKFKPKVNKTLTHWQVHLDCRDSSFYSHLLFTISGLKLSGHIIKCTQHMINDALQAVELNWKQLLDQKPLYQSLAGLIIGDVDLNFSCSQPQIFLLQVWCPIVMNHWDTVFDRTLVSKALCPIRRSKNVQHCWCKCKLCTCQSHENHTMCNCE